MDETILDKVYTQVLEETSHVINEEDRYTAAKQYVDSMTNWELLELLERVGY